MYLFYIHFKFLYIKPHVGAKKAETCSLHENAQLCWRYSISLYIYSLLAAQWDDLHHIARFNGISVFVFRQ
jgi:hypothetical protein